MPAIIGLTGGIASGKSTVSSYLRTLGAYVIDADQVARDVVEPGTPGLEQLVARFGEEMLTPQGTLDRAKLGSVVFRDAEARAALNAIVHPMVSQRMVMLAQEAEEEHGRRWVIYDAALLVENGLAKMFPELVVVSLDAETQLERLMRRDHLSLEEAEARLASQLPLEEKVALATHVIDNSQELEHTLDQVAKLYQFLMEKYDHITHREG